MSHNLEETRERLRRAYVARAEAIIRSMLQRWPSDMAPDVRWREGKIIGLAHDDHRRKQDQLVVLYDARDGAQPSIQD